MTAFNPKSGKQHELREDQKNLFFKRGELLYEVLGEGNTPLHTMHRMLITCFLKTKNMLVSDTSQYLKSVHSALILPKVYYEMKKKCKSTTVIRSW